MCVPVHHKPELLGFLCFFFFFFDRGECRNGWNEIGLLTSLHERDRQTPQVKVNSIAVRNLILLKEMFTAA